VALRWITLAVAAALIAPAALVLLLPARRTRGGVGPEVAPQAPRRGNDRLDLLWTALPAAFLVVLIALAARAAG
jgi:heme/copper-type cytochrome/quinol oxidase subunit 2